MISSASAQIEATGGDHLKTTIVKDGKRTVVPDYARVQGILIGTVAIYIIFLTIIGPECVLPQGIHHRHFISDFDCRVI
jgi:SHS family lactate transporter-like MFS transporter